VPGSRLAYRAGSDNPILFRSTAGASHGIGTSLKERIAEQPTFSPSSSINLE
jgi:hypothetical protein